MATLQRIRSAWSNFEGGPGVATFYATDAAAMLPDLQDFWDAIAPGLPSGLTITTESTGDEINDATALLTGGWSGTGISPSVGADGATYAAPVGATVTWVSDGLPWGYRVKGRTYLVPLGGGSYQDDGTLNPTNQGNIETAADALVAAQTGNFKVWNRPRKAKAADGSRPAVTQRAGTSWDVISAVIPDRAAVLRSRRD